MIILEVLNSCNSLFSKIHGAANLWRIEQAIDNKNVSIIPSYLTMSIIRNHLNENPIETHSILGVEHNNTDFLHSLAMWAMNGRTVKLADSILPFIQDMNILDRIEPSMFFNFPKQTLYIDNRIGRYDGALVCKDYIDNGEDRKEFILNISLLSQNGKGKQFSFMVPRKYDEDFLTQFDEIYDKAEIKEFLSLFIYILYEYGAKNDFFTQNSIDYIGFNLSDQIEQNRYKDGHWRKGHWHTYFVKNNGLDQFVIKLVKPTWVRS